MTRHASVHPASDPAYPPGLPASGSAATLRWGEGFSVDLNLLKYFRTTVEIGSISGAARVLQVSQPSLTNSIKRLEQHFSTTLLLRDSRGVTPTDSGRILLGAVGELSNVMDRTEKLINGVEDEEAGTFTLGSQQSLGAYFLPGLLRRMQTETPNIELHLWNGSSANVRRAVIEREIDFGLVVNPENHPDLVSTNLFHDRVELFVNTAEPEIEKYPVALARVAEGPLIYAGRVHQAQELTARLSEASVRPRRTLLCGDLELVKSLAIEGLGVAVLPRRVAHHQSEHLLRCLHPELPAYPDEIHLIYRVDHHRTKATLALRKAIRNQGRALSEMYPDLPS